MALTVGQKAPQFSLPDTTKTTRSLSEFAGKKVVLLFYPGAFTGVCDKEMCTVRDSMAAFNNVGAQVIGISVDGPWANKAFADKYNLTFPLLSDYNREVVKQYGVAFEGLGGLKGYVVANRAVFVLDSKGVVTYAWVAEKPGIEPPYDEVKKAAA